MWNKLHFSYEGILAWAPLEPYYCCCHHHSSRQSNTKPVQIWRRWTIRQNLMCFRRRTAREEEEEAAGSYTVVLDDDEFLSISNIQAWSTFLKTDPHHVESSKNMKLVVARRALDSSIFFGWWCLSDVICHLLRCVFHRQIFIAGLFHTKITTPHYFIVEHFVKKDYIVIPTFHKITFEVRNYALCWVPRCKKYAHSPKIHFWVKTSFDAKNYARPKVIRNMPSPLIFILLWYSDAVFFTLSEIFTQSVDSFQVCNHRESSENEI